MSRLEIIGNLGVGINGADWGAKPGKKPGAQWIACGSANSRYAQLKNADES